MEPPLGLDFTKDRDAGLPQGCGDVHQASVCADKKRTPLYQIGRGGDVRQVDV
jgi:hypothetical protein